MLELEPDFDVAAMKVPELKKELKARGLSVTGNKNELVERLQVSLLSSTDCDDIMAKADELLADEPKEVSTPTVEAPKEALVGTEALLKRDTALPVSAPADVAIVDSKEPDELSKGQTDAEKAAARLARFGSISTKSSNNDLKKMDRAKRFGLPISAPGENSNGTSKTPADLDVMKKRAERFGSVSSATMKQLEDAEKIQKRKERFGVVEKEEPVAKKGSFIKSKTLVSSPVDPETAEKLKKRAERFGSTQI